MSCQDPHAVQQREGRSPTCGMETAPCSNTGWGDSFAKEDLRVLVGNRLNVSTPEIHSNLNYPVTFYYSRGGIQ